MNPRFLSSEDREKLLAAYARWAARSDPADQWALSAIDDDIRSFAPPPEILRAIVDIVNRPSGDDPALGVVGAGLLEDLLFEADEEVKNLVAEEAAANPNLRSALAVVFAVKYNESGFEQLHELVLPEIQRLPNTRLRGD